jgi:hypothetical protein
MTADGCPTCSGPIRETVNMVCQTCGTDYGRPAAELRAIDAVLGLGGFSINDAAAVVDAVDPIIAGQARSEVEAMREWIARKGWCIDSGLPLSECIDPGPCDCGREFIEAEVRERLRAQVEALPYRNAGAWVKRADVLALLDGESNG